MIFLEILLLFFLAFGLVGTLLPLLPVSAWWVRAFDFPRFQLATVLLAAGALYAFSFADQWWEGGLVGVAALAFVYQVIRIFPYLPFARKQSKTAEVIRPDERVVVLMSNVLQTNHEAHRALQVYRRVNPDVIVAVETNGWWEKQLRPLEETYPHTIKEPLGNTYGMLLYSRLPLHDAEIRYLVEDDVPSFRVQIELRSGQRFRLYAVHPRPPMPGSDTYERDAELLIVGKEVREADEPALVVGDLNDVAWSHTTTLFQKTSGMLDPRNGRGFYSSFHAEKSLLRFPLDHFFHTPHFTFIRMERLEKIGSDHFPMLIELQYDPQAPAQQRRPEPDGEERREADKKIVEGKQVETKEQAQGEPDRTAPDGSAIN